MKLFFGQTKKRLLVAAVLAFGLVACPQPQPIKPAPMLEKPFQPRLLGSITVQFGGDSVKPVAFNSVKIRNQVLTPVLDSDFSFTALPTNVLDASASERFIVAPFRITNNTGAALSNITLIAYSKAGNTGGSAFKNIQSFSGVAAVDVNTLKPIHAMTGNSSVVVDNNHADMQIFKRREISALNFLSEGNLINNGVTGEGILQYGFVARKGSTGAYRTIAGTNCNPSSNAGCNDGTITLALKVPKASEPLSNVYRYSMTFLVFSDSVARVTESLEEQGTNNAATRAAPISAGLNSMCGTSLASSHFIPGVRTVGMNVDAAWMGGDFFDSTETALNITGSVGNTEKTFAGAVTTGRFTALGGATLSAVARDISSATTTNSANLGIAANGDVTLRPKVNARVTDGFLYQISDGSCTSPNIDASIAAPSATVWYVNSSAAINGDGRSFAPFQSLSSLNTANPASVTAEGDVIFVRNGSLGSTGLALKDQQQLIGSGVDLIVGSETLQTAGITPIISSPITVASSNSVKGLTVGGLSGTVGGTLTISSASVQAGTNQAINLSGGTLSINLEKVDSSNSSNAINLNGTSGSFAITGVATMAGSGGTLSNNSGDAIVLNNFGTVSLKNLSISGSGLNGIHAQGSTGTNNLTLTNVLVQNAGASGSSQDNTNGVRFISTGSSNSSLSINGSSSIIGSQQSGLQAFSNGTSSFAVKLEDSFLTNNKSLGAWIVLGSSGTNTFLVKNNIVDNSGSNGNGIRIWAVTPTTNVTQYNGRVLTNTIKLNKDASSGVFGLEMNAKQAANLKAEISDNIILDYRSYGLSVLTDSVAPLQSGGGSQLFLTLLRNTVSSSSSANLLEGMQFQAGTNTFPTFLCLNMQNNKSQVGSAGFTNGYAFIRLLASTTVGSTFQFEGITGFLPASQSIVTNLVNSRGNTDPNNATATVYHELTQLPDIPFRVATYSPATCAAPSGI